MVAAAHTSTRYVLHPGDIAIGTRGDEFFTLLGSCISVVLTDPARTVGAMCHIVHSGNMLLSPTLVPTSVAGPAIDTLYTMIRGAGLVPYLCECFVFGGGHVISVDGARLPAVGDQNARTVLARLEHDRIPIMICDVGDAVYRRVHWRIGNEQPRVTAVPVTEQAS